MFVALHQFGDGHKALVVMAIAARCSKKQQSTSVAFFWGRGGSRLNSTKLNTSTCIFGPAVLASPISSG